LPLDYGQRRKARSLRGLIWAAPVGVAVLGAVLVLNWRGHRALETDQGWIGDAPPCPTLSAEAWRARYAAHERATLYDDVTLTRQFGHVMCKDVDTAGGFGLMTHPACQFTSPTAIRVKRGPREDFFEPGPGRLATVSVERGRTLCALGGKFTLFHDPTELGPAGG
jgi:hypothetical protein